MKQSKYQVKLICGFRKDQEYTINANEAHKAYYLFNNPTKRGTFDNGLALKGSDIQRIVPDYQATMGWNATHQLTDDDYNELRSAGVLQKFNVILSAAKLIAAQCEVSELKQPLIDLYRTKYAGIEATSSYAKQLLTEKTDHA